MSLCCRRQPLACIRINRCAIYASNNVTEIEAFENWMNRKRYYSVSREICRWVKKSDASLHQSIFRMQDCDPDPLVPHGNGSSLPSSYQSVRCNHEDLNWVNISLYSITIDAGVLTKWKICTSESHGSCIIAWPMHILPARPWAQANPISGWRRHSRET